MNPEERDAMSRHDEQDDITVKDRRRFTADGALRDDAAPDAVVPDDVVESAPGPDAGTGAAAARDDESAREWERRAVVAENRLADMQDGFLRARDDLAATRSRLERDQEIRVREGVGRVFQRILVALDNLDRALAHAPDGPLADGVRLVHRQLFESMAAEGLEALDLLGKPFDPDVAEAVATSPAGEGQDPHTVIEVYRQGYRFGDRVLRAAQVRVAI
jgi:molecular chaperone GrpE